MNHYPEDSDRELFLKAVYGESDPDAVSPEDAALFSAWLESNTPALQDKGLSDEATKPPPRRNRNAEAEIDLHGKTRDEAALELRRFFDSCRSNGTRVVRVITGKGLHAATPGVLQGYIRDGLQHRAFGKIRSFRQAKAREGGSGAFIVELS